MFIPERLNSICFTGHRDLTANEKLLIKERLHLLLPLLISRGLQNCYAGGAVGMDTIASLVLLQFKEHNPSLKFHLILPCQGQEKSWNDEQKNVYAYLKTRADSVRILSPFYYNGCMQMRNRELLASSDLCIAYLRSRTKSGGSLNTVIQAAKLGIPVINLAQTESED